MNEMAPTERVARLFRLSPGSARLQEALTHPSFAHETRGAQDNQRLEFLGDAILDFITSQILFENFPQANEGELTRIRAQVVNTLALAEFARHHALAPALRLGRGAKQNQLQASDNVLADAVEALLAATYLENGLETACAVCRKIVELGLKEVERAGARDAKSELQERVQALGHPAPLYEVVTREGPAHDTTFEVVVQVNEEVVGRGRGRSKRLAEQEAAKNALLRYAPVPGAVS